MLCGIETLFAGIRNGESEAQDVCLIGLSKEKEGSMGCHEVRARYRFWKG